MSGTIVDADPRVQIFSATKYEIMQLLKRQEGTDLEVLSKTLGVSQMAVYKHLRELEKDGLVEHVARKNGVGRPRMFFRPTPSAAGVYPTSYSYLFLMTLEYIEDRLGKEGLDDVARRVQDRAVGRYKDRVGNGTLYQKAKRLVAVREDHGFYGEAKMTDKGAIEYVNHNCPVALISSRYPSLCEQERAMMQRVLDAKVERISSDPLGIEPCKFVITSRQGRS
ncbi:MAG TPA: helix-turn-helix domain-containing protein [Nitrososphaerales archaeon]|nr:helix-turn-helix domain-containing protein [Nitrososphaerales archaeon]